MKNPGSRVSCSHIQCCEEKEGGAASAALTDDNAVYRNLDQQSVKLFGAADINYGLIKIVFL